MMEKFQNLALLIDAENIALDKLESVIQKTSAYGRIVIQRAYGDWSKESLKNWKDSLNRFGIKAQQQFNYTPKKNSTDMALTIDALDLLYQSSYDALAIVSSDCDFTPCRRPWRRHGPRRCLHQSSAPDSAGKTRSVRCRAPWPPRWRIPADLPPPAHTWPPQRPLKNLCLRAGAALRSQYRTYPHRGTGPDCALPVNSLFPLQF